MAVLGRSRSGAPPPDQILDPPLSMSDNKVKEYDLFVGIYFVVKLHIILLDLNCFILKCGTRKLICRIDFDNNRQHCNISGGSRISHRGWRAPIGGGCGAPTQALFSENVCENERIGSHRGERAPGMPPPPPLDPPMNMIQFVSMTSR